MCSLKNLCEIDAVSGYERNIIQYIKTKVDGLFDEVHVDRVGNLICYKKGKIGNEKILFSAHIDEVGFQIMDEVEEGRYSFKTFGNIKAWDINQRVVNSSSAKGIIVAYNEENIQKYNFENFYLKPLNGEVNIGDVFSFECNYEETATEIISKALDNRAGAYCLLNAALNDIETNADIYYVFTVQEEVGMRGIRTAKTSINPDVCYVIDASAVCDRSNIKLNRGVAIKISDAVSISTPRLVDYCKKIASDTGITYQMEVSDCGATELIISNELDGGSEEIGISIPCEKMHTANSIVNKEDIESCSKLLEAILSAL